MNILCVIPVRGGSKGSPGKNARSVAGKPLVVWSIEQALAAGLDVLVSTDDADLAEIARRAGISPATTSLVIRSNSSGWLTGRRAFRPSRTTSSRNAWAARARVGRAIGSSSGPCLR